MEKEPITKLEQLILAERKKQNKAVLIMVSVCLFLMLAWASVFAYFILKGTS